MEHSFVRAHVLLTVGSPRGLVWPATTDWLDLVTVLSFCYQAALVGLLNGF